LNLLNSGVAGSARPHPTIDCAVAAETSAKARGADFSAIGQPPGGRGFILMLLNGDISTGRRPGLPERRSRRLFEFSGGFSKKNVHFDIVNCCIQILDLSP
jgi:hypothetical protein